jgi:hypothetical protein
MVKLQSLDQLKVGTKLKIVGLDASDNYGSISVKKILYYKPLNGDAPWTEILINRRKNFYFHFENYLKGESNWVKEVYVLNGVDKRLKPQEAR